MDFMIPFSVFTFVVLVIVGGYWLLFRQPDIAAQRLEQLAQPGVTQLKVKAEKELNKIALQVAEPLQKLAPISAENAQKLQKKLMYAGFLSPQATIIYRTIQLCFLVSLPLFTFLLWLSLGYALNDSYKWLILAVFLAYVVPRQTLDNMVAGRQQRLRWGLADALDLMVVTIESGLGLNAAIVRVSQEIKKFTLTSAANLNWSIWKFRLAENAKSPLVI